MKLKDLLNILASKDISNRIKDREMSVIKGKHNVSSLTIALKNSNDDHFRLEAAKLLEFSAAPKMSSLAANELLKRIRTKS